MTPAPTVTVITTVYRRTSFLGEALDSAMAQTMPDFELIVSDDAQSPEVEAMVRSRADTRIRYVATPRRLGMLGNKMFAYQKSRGEFVANLDDDDAWEPTFLEKLLRPLGEASVVVAFADHDIVDQRGQIDPQRSEANSRRYKRDKLRAGFHADLRRIGLVHGAIPTVQAAVLRRSAADWTTIPATVGPLYDQWLTYLLSRSGGGYYVPERLARYRVHRDMYTLQNRVEMSEAAIDCYERLVADPHLRPIRGALRRKGVDARLSLGLALLHADLPAPARPHLTKAMPMRMLGKAGAGWLLSWTPTRMRRVMLAARGRAQSS